MTVEPASPSTTVRFAMAIVTPPAWTVAGIPASTMVVPTTPAMRFIHPDRLLRHIPSDIAGLLWRVRLGEPGQLDQRRVVLGASPRLGGRARSPLPQPGLDQGQR